MAENINPNLPHFTPRTRDHDSRRRGFAQFTLRQALVATAVFSLLFAMASWGGVLGVALLFFGIVEFAVLWVIIKRGSWPYLLGGLAIILPAVFVVLWGCVVAVGDGWPKLPVKIFVSDATTKLPVVGAAISVRDGSHSHPEGAPPVRPIPPGELAAKATSDSLGAATLTWRFPVTSRDSAFHHEASVYVYDYDWFQIDAPGYKPLLVRLDSLLGRSYDWYKLPLPPIRIALQPEQLDKLRADPGR